VRRGLRSGGQRDADRAQAFGNFEESIVKRFHVHVGVRDLDESIRFYSSLFGAEPAVRKPDYAKWMIEDPRVNFAISQRRATFGVNHLGLQVDEADELPALKARFEAADKGSLVDEPGVSCCYAKSDKHWVTDPQGIAWEGWHNLGAVEVVGEAHEANEAQPPVRSGCCSPAATTATMPQAARSGCCT
jgi:catechol 2,3-dioxygenase-like lactoylglutathione lyase family enzyme